MSVNLSDYDGGDPNYVPPYSGTPDANTAAPNIGAPTNAGPSDAGTSLPTSSSITGGLANNPDLPSNDVTAGGGAIGFSVNPLSGLAQAGLETFGGVVAGIGSAVAAAIAAINNGLSAIKGDVPAALGNFIPGSAGALANDISNLSKGSSNTNTVVPTQSTYGSPAQVVTSNDTVAILWLAAAGVVFYALVKKKVI